MIELGTMLILGGCLVYSLFNALFFAFVYYRRRQLEREEGLALTEFDPHGDQHVHAHSAGPGALKFQVVPIERPLSHNAWLHEVAMRHLCSSSKLVAVKTLHGHNKDNDGGVEAGPIRQGDILLRIRNLYGPFTDAKLVTRFFHRNRKFDTPVLVYRYDQERAVGEVLDVVVKPGTEMGSATFEKMPVKTNRALSEAFNNRPKRQNRRMSRDLKERVFGGGAANTNTTDTDSSSNRASAAGQGDPCHQHPCQHHRRRWSGCWSEDSGEECGICFENYPNAILHPCGHRICVNCHNNMYVKSCPYCREPIKRCQYELLV